MKLTLFYLFLWTNLTFCKEYRELRDIFANEKCKCVTNRQWSLFRWYFRNVNYLKVVDIYDKDDGNVIEKDYVASFMNSTFQNLNMMVIVLSRNLQSEDDLESEIESYSRQGDRFVIRPMEFRRRLYPRLIVKSVRHRDETFFGVLLVVRNLNVLQKFLVGSARIPFQAPRGMFAISVMDPYTKSDKILLNDVMKKLWRDYGIAHSIVFFTSNDETFFYFDPFDRSNSSQSDVNSTTNWGSVKFLKTDVIKLPENQWILRGQKRLNGYPLSVVMFRRLPTSLLWKELPKYYVDSYFCNAKAVSTAFGAYDGILLGNLIAALNATVQTIPPHSDVEYGYQSDNGTYIGAIGDVVYSRADIAFNSRFIIDYNTTEIEFTSAVYFDKFCIVCPKALQIPAALTVFSFYSYDVWVAIFFTNTFFGVLWYLLKKWTSKYNEKRTSMMYRALDFSIIETWVIMTSGAASRMPYNTIERLFLASCLMLSIVETSLFQGALTMSFSTISYYKDVNTLRELAESPLPIGTSSKSLMNIFGEDKSPLMDALRRKFLLLNVSTIDEAALNRNVCCIERAADIRIIKTMRYENADGTPKLHTVPECPRAYGLGYIVRKGWPFLESVNRLLLQFMEAGLTQKWYAGIEEAFMMDKKYKNPDMIDGQRHVLSLEDVQIAFLILAIGISFSSVVFVLEIIIKKHGTRIADECFKFWCSRNM